MIGIKESGKTVRKRQDPLMKRYLVKPKEAAISDNAKTTDGVKTDPFHGSVSLGDEELGVDLPFGIHKAVGGYSDAPNPGDLLCGALSSCLGSTIRIMAERFGVKLTALEVDVAADLDVRGTLQVDRNVPVGFQRLRCRVNVSAAEGTDPNIVKGLVDAAERSCVVMQTLISGVSIESSLNQIN